MLTPKFSVLDENKVAKIKRLEEELGGYVIAFDHTPELAVLSPEQLQKVNAIQKEVGATLVAYKGM